MYGVTRCGVAAGERYPVEPSQWAKEVMAELQWGLNARPGCSDCADRSGPHWHPYPEKPAPAQPWRWS